MIQQIGRQKSKLFRIKLCIKSVNKLIEESILLCVFLYVIVGFEIDVMFGFLLYIIFHRLYKFYGKLVKLVRKLINEINVLVFLVRKYIICTLIHEINIKSQ